MPSMIITCPHCQARFDVEESRFLPSGRSVRCSDCSTSWFVPAPQTVETLSPRSKIQPETPYQGTHNRPASRNHDDIDNDLFDQYARSQQSAPIAGHPAGQMRRRRTDQVVDTDWHEVRASAPQERYDNPGHQNRDQTESRERPTERPTLRRKPADTPTASPIDKIVRARRAHPDKAPGEVFAAINVQPRELEVALKRVRRKAEARNKNRLTPFRVIGWMMLGCLSAGTLYGGYHYRNDVVRIFPGTAKAYATIGINTKPFGLSLENIDYRVALSTSGPILEIKGELHNQGDKLVGTPLLQAEALDSRGRLLASWTFSPAQSSVPGGSFTAFATRNPAPEGVVEVVLSFASHKSRTEP